MPCTTEQSQGDDQAVWRPDTPPRGKQPNWLGWGLALLILVGCAFFVELRQIALLLLISTADRLVMARQISRAPSCPAMSVGTSCGPTG